MMTSSKNLTDPDFCISQFKLGNIKAYENIFHRFYAALCYFSEKITHDRLASEDIVSDVFVKLWEYRTTVTFDHMGAVRSYLYSCTRNASINALETGKRNAQKEKSFTQEQPVEEEFILNTIIKSEVLREIHVALETLPTKCKNVFHLAIHRGLTTEEIAQQLGISTSTVRNHKAYGVYLLRKKLPEGTLWLMIGVLLAERYVA